MTAVRWAKGLARPSLLALGAASAAESGGPLVDHVRAANGRFEDVSVVVAEGYAPIPCTTALMAGRWASTTSTQRI